ncbi:hypothetical protein [Streptacidiphilus cavernicola]|uniref:Uncharacterized protein n=1 Tax=Streptacidiphilus cavernicola TaxID=3342716 RepID=A0ABV6W4C2_9ACTN
MTQAVAEQSAQAEEGRTPRRRVVHWRYGMGFVLLLASILSLVLVGQIAGWIQDPHDSARAGEAAEFRASALQAALRALPVPGGGVPEAAYAAAVRSVRGVLLDLDYPAAPGAAPTGLTVRLLGSVTSGVLSGHHTTVVTSCYHFDWSTTPATAARSQVPCPTAPVQPAIHTGGGGGGTDSEDAAGSASALVGLAMRLNGLAPAQQAVDPDPAGTRQLLGAAAAAPGVPWHAAYPWRDGQGSAGRVRDTVLAIGTGGVAGCLFVDVHAGALTAWTAPQLAPCTAARAAQAVMVT